MVKCGAVTIFNQSLGGVAETYPIGQYVKHPNMYVNNKEKHTFKVESRDENQATQSEEGNEITDCHNMTDDIGSQENADKNNCHPEETTDNNFEGNNYCDDPDKKVAENIFKKIIKTENKTGEENSIDGYLQFLDSLNSIFETSRTPSVTGGVGDVRMEDSSMVADDGSEELEGGNAKLRTRVQQSEQETRAARSSGSAHTDVWDQSPSTKEAQLMAIKEAGEPLLRAIKADLDEARRMAAAGKRRGLGSVTIADMVGLLASCNARVGAMQGEAARRQVAMTAEDWELVERTKETAELQCMVLMEHHEEAGLFNESRISMAEVLFKKDARERGMSPCSILAAAIPVGAAWV